MLPCRKKAAVLNADKKHRYGLPQGIKMRPVQEIDV